MQLLKWCRIYRNRGGGGTPGVSGRAWGWGQQETGLARAEVDSSSPWLSGLSLRSKTGAASPDRAGRDRGLPSVEGGQQWRGRPL